MRGQRKNPRKAVQPFENKKRKIDIFKNYEANGVEKIQRKLEIFSTLISKKSTNGLRTTKVKLDRLPAIYATTGISEEIKQICAALEITVPEDYETAASLRKKLALRGELGSYFQNKETITTEEKKSEN